MSDPPVSIAGREWRIPLLAPRQNRVVLPVLMERTRDYGRLADCVFAAMTRACPYLDRSEFDDWPVPLCELLDAIPVVARQTGFMERGRPNGGGSSEPPDWDAIIAEACNFLPGTTPDYWEDALTAPRLRAMREEWRLHPPMQVLAAAWLGYKPRPRGEDAVAELMRVFPGGKLSLHPTIH